MENAISNLKSIFTGKRLIIIFLILTIGALTCFVAIFVPAARNLGNLQSQFKAQSLRLEEIRKAIASSGKTRSRMVVDLEEAAQALDEITKKSAQSNFKFDSIKQGEPFVIGGNFKILPITIESTCSFQALSDFVAGLENLSRSVVVVQRLDVAKDKANSKNLKVSLVLGMYLLI